MFVENKPRFYRRNMKKQDGEFVCAFAAIQALWKINFFISFYFFFQI